MKSTQIFPAFFAVSLAIAPAFAQSTNNWSRFDNAAPQTSSSQPDPSGPQISSSQPDGPVAQASPDQYPQAPPPPGYGQQNNGGYPNGGYQNAPYPNGGPGYNANGGYQGGMQGQGMQGQYGPPAPQQKVPDALNLSAGQYVTVRVNNFLTTDHNQPGDAFTASLIEPIVIDGFVVAQRGQMVTGRVVEVEKAGRVKGVSSMRIELTGVTLVDGQQLPLKTQLMYRKGETSNGRDAGAIIGTSALGTIVGAAATGTGFGAGMGAIGGALVGTVGVLTTRGRPTVITPESVMTFQVTQPLTISTVRSANAFYPVSREDFGPSGPSGPGGGPHFAARPYGYPAVGGYPYAPYPYYGAAFYGPGFYYGGYARFGYYGYGRRGWR